MNDGYGKIYKRPRKRSRVARVGRDVLIGIGHRHMGTYASSTTFYYFLALVPILIFISLLLPLTGMEENDLVTAVTAVTPDVLDTLVESIISEAYSHSGNLIPISVISLLWTSIQGNLALLQGLNDAYREEEHRNYLVLVLVSLVWTLVLAAVFMVLVYFIFSSKIQAYITEYLPDERLTVLTFTWTRRVLCFLLAAVIFAILYTHMPAGKRRFVEQLPGAVFAAAIWVVFSVFFAMYVNGVNKYTTFYGSLGTFAILLFWMYCCFYILLVGAFINECFQDSIRKGINKLPEPVHEKIRRKIRTRNHHTHEDK